MAPNAALRSSATYAVAKTAIRAAASGSGLTPRREVSILVRNTLVNGAKVPLLPEKAPATAAVGDAGAGAGAASAASTRLPPAHAVFAQMGEQARAQQRPLTWYMCGPTVYDEAHIGKQ